MDFEKNEEKDGGVNDFCSQTDFFLNSGLMPHRRFKQQLSLGTVIPGEFTAIRLISLIVGFHEKRTIPCNVATLLYGHQNRSSN